MQRKSKWNNGDRWILFNLIIIVLESSLKLNRHQDHNIYRKHEIRIWLVSSLSIPASLNKIYRFLWYNLLGLGWILVMLFGKILVGQKESPVHSPSKLHSIKRFSIVELLTHFKTASEPNSVPHDLLTTFIKLWSM